MPVAVVTGAAGGIGTAIVARLRQDAWRVHGLDRAWPASRRTDDDVAIDLADLSALDRLLSSLGPVDALINNAAVMWRTGLVDSDLADVEALFRVNVLAPFAAIRALAPRLAETRGAIVNISSVHAAATSPGAAPYAASKAALTALTRSAALELAPDVRVNAVAPGAIQTPMVEAGRQDSPEQIEFLVKRTPLGRIGDPGEVAEAVAFLVDGTRSGFITGETLTVDGGVLSRLASE